MHYQANPVRVNAYEIVSVGPVLQDGSMHIATNDGVNRTATSGMVSRMAPVAGDYWVIQSDGYEYLNPKDVFERKYSLIPSASVA